MFQLNFAKKLAEYSLIFVVIESDQILYGRPERCLLTGTEERTLQVYGNVVHRNIAVNILTEWL
jgi:hypothetical protein